MTFGVRWGIPKNSILRRGILIVGVPRQKPQLPKQSKADPMAAAALSLEEGLQQSIAERNAGTLPAPHSASTASKPDENT